MHIAAVQDERQVWVMGYHAEHGNQKKGVKINNDVNGERA